MLPAKDGSPNLSVASREKMDAFYQRFCEGANGQRYGAGAMVYACHAAFPLLLSADLANLLWLNFNVYTGSDGKVRKVDRILVSDFLLSSLVRPVGSGQFEIIPEIRTYLLWLLKDGRWLRVSGADINGPQHLFELANFLRSYLADKRFGRANQSAAFRELNEWAALCYLEPDLLAARMAEAYSKTFSRGPGQADDETGQLRLNMMMDRLGQQLELEIHDQQAATPTAFVNLRRYSRANKARLFEKGYTEVSDLFFTLDKAFIGGDAKSRTTIDLPVLKGVSERLKRKKENVQRVFALYVEPGTDDPIFADVDCSDYLSSAVTLAAEGAKVVLRDKQLAGDQAGFGAIETAVRDFTAEMNDEDILFLYLAGTFVFEPQSSGFVCGVDKTVLTPAQLGSWLIAGHKKVYTVLVLDGNPNGRDWLDTANIVLSSGRDEKEDSFVLEVGKSKVTAFVLFLVDAFSAEKWLTYADVEELARYRADVRPSWDLNERPHPSFWARDRSELNKHFLSHEQKDPDQDFLLSYNPIGKDWDLVLPDFSMPPLTSGAELYPYGSASVLGSGSVGFENGRLRYVGDTNKLVTENAYKVKSQRQPLYYRFSSGIDPSDPITGWLRAFDFPSLGKFSLWDRLKYESLQTKTSEDTTGRQKIWVQKVGAAPAQGYNITWISVGEGSIETEAGTWAIASQMQLDALLMQLSRFAYLSALALPGAGASSPYIPFDLAIYFDWAVDGTETNEGVQGDQVLAIDHRCMTTNNGRIGFRDFVIDIDSREFFALYYDIYLLCSDLSIRKLAQGNIRLEAGGKRQHIFREQKVLERVFAGEITAEIKVLASKDPFEMDWTQPGIQKKTV